MTTILTIFCSILSIAILLLLISATLMENVDDGCFHRGSLDNDAIWICQKCNRRWYFSYLGGGGWVSIKTQEMEDYLRGKS